MRQLDLAKGAIGRGIIAAGLVASTAACNQAKFSGEAPRYAEKPPEPIGRSFVLGCARSDDEVVRERIEVKARQTVNATVTGELCLQGAARATVLFVIDMSGSMGKHRRPDTGEIAVGNDPTVLGQQGGQGSQAADTCGRLAAVTALLARLEAEMGDAAGSSVDVGLVAFAGDILPERVVKPLPLAAFRDQMSSEQICRYVVQSSEFGTHPQNPGGLSDSAGSSTNYAAALDQATLLLASQPAGRTVYFVSDGEPTSAPGGADPLSASVRAAARLRGLGSDVVLNGLLLGADGAKARSVMTEVVGAPERVRLAAKADELAGEVLSFPTPNLAPETVTATLRDLGDESAAPRAINLVKLQPKPDGAAPGTAAWIFETDVMTFASDHAETSRYRFEVEAHQGGDPTSEPELGEDVSAVRSRLDLEVVRF